jgi:hypothetical protein
MSKTGPKAGAEVDRIRLGSVSLPTYLAPVGKRFLRRLP